jgi:putative FmdB family regulatory protein
MPTYSYRCSECGVFDWIHPINTMVDMCPKCGSPDISKVFNTVGISFKGSGFYSTDSKGK